MRQKLLLLAGLLALALFVNNLPWERQSSEITGILHIWSERQEEISEEVTTSTVAGVEGELVGEHIVDGSNWSIPNIIRHWLRG